MIKNFIQLIKTHKGVVFIVFCTFLVVPQWILFAQTPTSTLQITYPTFVPGFAPPRSVQTFLPHYIRYLYTTAVFLGGLIGLFAFLKGGFTYLTSAGNPGKMKDAKEQILYGLIGLLIILGSYVILNEIDPNLTNISLPNIHPFREGIIIYNRTCNELLSLLGGGDVQQLGLPELLDFPNDVRYLPIANTRDRDLKWPGNISPGLEEARSFFTFHGANELSIAFYNVPGFSGDPVFDTARNMGGTQLEANHCYNFPSPIKVEGVKFKWYRPGVWLFSYDGSGANEPLPDPREPWDGCQRKPCYTYLRYSVSSLPGGLSDHIRAIAFVGTTDSSPQKFGAILHNIPGQIPKERGWAQIFLPDQNHDITLYTFNNDLSASSVTVFQIPQRPKSRDITLCRNPRCEEQEYNNNGTREYHRPHLIISWEDGDVQLEDISNNICTNHNNVTTYTAARDGDLQSSAPSCPQGIVGWAQDFQINQTVWQGNNGDVPGNERVGLGRVSRGVSSVEIEPDSEYIVLLYRENLNNVNQIVNNLNTDVAALTFSIPDLSTIRMNERVGEVVVIRAKFK